MTSSNQTHTKLTTSPSSWDGLSHLDWRPSDLTEGMYQTMITVQKGVDLCVEAGGDPKNPPILLIMGLGSQMIFWPDSFIQRLWQAGFFVIRFDNRDIGLSSKIQIEGLPHVNQVQMMLRVQAGLSNKRQPVAYNLSDMAEDTIQLIKKLNFKKINLLGASMGGMIAQILAARYPNYIDKIVLLFTTNNQGLLPPPKPKQFFTLIKRPESHSERDMVRHGVWFMKTVGSPGHVDVKQVREIASLRYHRNFHPLGIMQQLNAILASGSLKRFDRQIKAPTLIIHGSKDGLVPASHGKALAKSIKNAKFYLIDGMGHDIPDYYQPYIVHLIQQHISEHLNPSMPT